MSFNFHTHNKSKNNSLFNLRIGIDADMDEYPYYFSAGIHPWDIGSIDVPINLLKLTSYLQQENCIALGEVGLDKVCGTDLDYQKKVFREQLHIAHKSNTKVLIIHCVKSYQEIIEEKKQCPYEFKWVLHAFNGSEQLIQQLIKHGFYFSLGEALLNPNFKITKSASSIPLDRIFLETDESAIGIDKIYQKASEIFEVDIHRLEKQIEKNIELVFGINVLKT